jgi:hypothetical protein
MKTEITKIQAEDLPNVDFSAGELIIIKGHVVKNRFGDIDDSYVINKKADSQRQNESTDSIPKRFVTNKRIQEKAGVSDVTVRRWAEEFGWEQLKINDRVIRFSADDIERTVGVSFD